MEGRLVERNRRRCRIGLALGMLAAGHLHAASWSELQPTSAYGQFGVAKSTRATTVGAVWAWDSAWSVAGGRLSGSWELSLGRWSATAPGEVSRTWVGQFGVTPVLRYWPAATPRWFIEGGIGVHLISPLYRGNDKQFATRFNFGDHLAAGLLFGEQQQHELALRIQHFSNGGIREPNPGENFWQLRYSFRFAR
jgi:lipid A 3-O-deacylase